MPRRIRASLGDCVFTFIPGSHRVVQEAGVPPQPELIAETINLIAFIVRTPRGRRVTELVRVEGYHPQSGFELVLIAAEESADDERKGS